MSTCPLIIPRLSKESRGFTSKTCIKTPTFTQTGAGRTKVCANQLIFLMYCRYCMNCVCVQEAIKELLSKGQMRRLCVIQGGLKIHRTNNGSTPPSGGQKFSLWNSSKMIPWKKTQKQALVPQNSPYSILRTFSSLLDIMD